MSNGKDVIIFLTVELIKKDLIKRVSIFYLMCFLKTILKLY